MKIPLFDIDGTLLSSEKNTVGRASFDYAIEKIFGIKASIDEVVSHGKIDPQILVEILALHGVNEHEVRKKLPETMKTMVDYFMEHQNEGDYTPLPGATDLLKSLREKGFLVGILTGNVEGAGWQKLKNSGLKRYIDFGAFGSQGTKTLKRVELVGIAQKKAEELLKKEVEPSDLVIVGDAKGDIDCAIAGGALSIGVPTGGGYTYQELKDAGANMMVNSLQEKDKILEFLSRI